MLQTISNPDGSMSIIQIDPGDIGPPQIVTLADGTQAQIVHAQIGPQQVQLDNTMVHPLVQDVTTSHGQLNTQAHLIGAGVDLNNMQVASYADATINSEGQLVITGGADANTLNGVVSIPMSMYQNVVGGIPTLNGQNIIISSLGGDPGSQHNTLTTIKLDQDQLVSGSPHLTHHHHLGHVMKQSPDEIELQCMTESSPIEVVTIDSSRLQHVQQHHHHHPDSESDT